VSLDVSVVSANHVPPVFLKTKTAPPRLENTIEPKPLIPVEI